jgi:SH3-like domain-containing protein
MAGRRRIASIALALTCILVAGGVGWSLFAKHSESRASAATAGEMTGAIDPKQRQVGPSGLAIPRFVSLKAEKVNVRRGPSSDHPVAWVFQRKGLPVEIIAEFENWRRIRDSEGEEGWILQNMLAGKRTAVVAPWRQDRTVPMRSSATGDGAIIAQLSSGVLGEVSSCTGDWCEIAAGGYEGWVEQSMLWGVYPGEKID